MAEIQKGRLPAGECMINSRWHVGEYLLLRQQFRVAAEGTRAYFQGHPVFPQGLLRARNANMHVSTAGPVGP